LSKSEEITRDMDPVFFLGYGSGSAEEKKSGTGSGSDLKFVIKQNINLYFE